MPVPLNQGDVELLVAGIVVNQREAVFLRVEVTDFGANRATVTDAIDSLFDGKNVAAPTISKRAQIERATNECFLWGGIKFNRLTADQIEFGTCVKAIA